MSNVQVALGLFGLQELYGDDPRGLLEAARLADRAGIDQINLVDHVVMGERTDRYPYGNFPVPLEYPWYEPMTVLAAIAGATERVRIATGVLIAPLRPAVLLAKQVATLDRISGGRLDLGVGTGWQREEYQASGIPFTGRMARMQDQLRACRALWRDSPASFESETVSFERIWSEPKPVQDPLPLWFGIAPNAPGARRIAELGVGWLPIDGRPEAVTEGVTQLRRAFEEAGRDPGELRVRAQLRLRRGGDGLLDLEKSRAERDRALESGVTMVEVGLFGLARSRDEVPDWIARIAELKK